MSKIQLHRTLYGHDGVRYRILETSCPELSNAIESLCEQIGTPNGTERTVPFLFSVPSPHGLIMVQVQSGKRDKVHRQTLEFRAIISSQEDVDACHFNAFVIQQMGLFRSQNYSTVIEIDKSSFPKPDTAFLITSSWNGPHYVTNSEPDPQKIRTLGNRINHVGWSAFSFQVLKSPFEFYVLSDRAALPENVNVQNVWESTAKQALPETATKATYCSKFFMLGLIASVLLNFILLACTIHASSDGPQTLQPHKSEEEIQADAWRSFDPDQQIQEDEWGRVKQTFSYRKFQKDNEKVAEHLDYYLKFVNEKLQRFIKEGDVQ
ncbi:MAG: hypothetical protein Q4D98_07360 [Planctomycetia bacterium]|nr:hypothetical protein [Planctomycetia bacterium]